jgi:hypothetical protein
MLKHAAVAVAVAAAIAPSAQAATMIPAPASSSIRSMAPKGSKHTFRSYCRTHRCTAQPGAHAVMTPAQ